MESARRCVRRVASSQSLRFLPDLNDPAAFQYQIQFVLPFVEVRRVLLAGFERVQADENVITSYDSALAHFVFSEGGATGDRS